MEKNYSDVEAMREQQVQDERDICGFCDASSGRKSHVDWEAVRGNENECDAESRLRHNGGVLSRSWWDGWFERSDEWRDEIGLEA